MRRLTVGLTGSIGAGKSEALAALARLGAATADCDAVARELSAPGGVLARAVSRSFGPRFLSPDGSVDRPALARLVFARPAARRKLERLSHPLILAEVRRRLRRSRVPVAVVAAPLLFEAGLGSSFDVTAAVTAPWPARLARSRRRDRSTAAQVRARARAQWPERRIAARADVALANAGTLADFRRRVAQYYRAWELIAQGS